MLPSGTLVRFVHLYYEHIGEVACCADLSTNMPENCGQLLLDIIHLVRGEYCRTRIRNARIRSEIKPT
jgi:hypothetical protein